MSIAYFNTYGDCIALTDGKDPPSANQIVAEVPADTDVNNIWYDFVTKAVYERQDYQPFEDKYDVGAQIVIPTLEGCAIFVNGTKTAGGPLTLDTPGSVYIEIKGRYRLRQWITVLDYVMKRAEAYPSIVEQLDLLFHEGFEGWQAVIDAIKAAFPKPEDDGTSQATS